jgi:hypothetical protein
MMLTAAIEGASKGVKRSGSRCNFKARNFFGTGRL